MKCGVQLEQVIAVEDTAGGGISTGDNSDSESGSSGVGERQEEHSDSIVDQICPSSSSSSKGNSKNSGKASSFSSPPPNTVAASVIVNTYPGPTSTCAPESSLEEIKATGLNKNCRSGKYPSAQQERIFSDSSEITTIREFTTEQSTSVSGVLRFCKRRILFPYLKLLGVMGLKPLYSVDTNDLCVFTLVLSKLYVVLVGLVLLMGYFLHFMTCFRRDQGFSYKDDIANPPFSTSLEEKPSFEVEMNNSTLFFSPSSEIFAYKKENWLLENTICKGNVIYVYGIPSVFHFLCFLYMVYLYWVNDDEHLQNLMERVFIHAAHANVNIFSQKRLIRKLQGLVCIGCLWILLTTGCQILQVYLNKIYVNFWIEADQTTTNIISALLLFSTLWQDAIQITVVISFGIHCHLIRTYIELLRARLTQHSISLSECMKELGELGQLLRYLNDELAPGMAPLLLIDGVYATGTIVHLIGHGTSLPLCTFFMLSGTAALWIFIVFFPLTQAAKLSTSCRKLKDMGHELRIRPFGYQFVPQFDLDSFLLFVSNLNLKVKIVKVPITSAIVSAFAVCLLIAVLVWGYFQ